MGRSKRRRVLLDPAVLPGPAESAAPDGDFVELHDPKLYSRLLYSNPVCILTTVDQTLRRRNAMCVSWLTPLNNHGVFLMAINKQRHTAKYGAAVQSCPLLSLPSHVILTPMTCAHARFHASLPPTSRRSGFFSRAARLASAPPCVGWRRCSSQSGGRK